jgi:predicted alpha/beta superfamily hydrolase
MCFTRSARTTRPVLLSKLLAEMRAWLLPLLGACLIGCPDGGQTPDDGGLIADGQDGAALDDDGPADDDGSPAEDGDGPQIDYTITSHGRFLEVSPLPYPGLLPRGVTIYLPLAYEAEPARRFPVLYMHDGQNLFEASQAAFGVEWRLDETLDELTAEGSIPPVIAVGVHNTAERLSDYTPDADPTYGGGLGDAYADFLVQVLKPIVDRELRTRPERTHTSLAGSSLGGIISLHVFLRHPQVFGRVGCVSPSLWWNDRSPTRAFQAHAGLLPERLWLCMGTGEGSEGLRGPYLIEYLRELGQSALAKDMSWADGLGALEDPLARHDEASWAARLPAILAFLLGEARPDRLPPTALSVYAHRRHLVPDAAAGLVGVEARYGARGRLTWPAELVLLETSAPQVAVIESGGVRGVAPGACLVRASLQGLGAEAPVWVGDDGGSIVSFAAHVPPGTPVATGVWLSGDRAELGAWNGAGLELRELRPGLWLGSAGLPRGAGCRYKYTRGGWATVEKAADGSERPDRQAAADGLDVLVEDWIERWADR